MRSFLTDVGLILQINLHWSQMCVQSIAISNSTIALLQRLAKKHPTRLYIKQTVASEER